MSHFAIVAPPFFSHFRALEALALVLVRRGHRVVFVQRPEAATLVKRDEVGFATAGTPADWPVSLTVVTGRAARPGGPLGIVRVVSDVAGSTDLLCRHLPGVLAALRVDAVIADQMEAAGGLVAESMGLPWVSVACALPINAEPAVPPPFLDWRYDDSDRGRRRNRGGDRVSQLLMYPLTRVIARHAAGFGLAPRRALTDCLSHHAQISQTVAAFDFPRRALPANFHAVGPLRLAHARQVGPLPEPKRRPLIFVSLGTLQGGRFRLFRRIVRACRRLNAEVWLAHCGGLDARQCAALRDEGAAWVTDFAPQPEVLCLADAVVTHAGLNTVLDGLRAGVPMLALPLAFDQPGVAARLVHHGAGRMLSPHWSGEGAIAAAMADLLAEPAYRRNARTLGQAVAAAGGCTAAADVIERVLGARTGSSPSHAAPATAMLAT